MGNGKLFYRTDFITQFNVIKTNLIRLLVENDKFVLTCVYIGS